MSRGVRMTIASPYFPFTVPNKYKIFSVSLVVRTYEKTKFSRFYIVDMLMNDGLNMIKRREGMSDQQNRQCLIKSCPMHFNLIMKTKQSLPVKSPLFVAPYPVSLTFPATRTACFSLKLQRNLMPIAVFDTLPAQNHEPKVQHFTIPSPLQTYQLRSMKDVSFQWSLHICNKEKILQFVQMRRFSIAAQVENHERQGETVFELEQEFNNVKCRFQYLVFFAQSEAELELQVQRYTSKSSKSEERVDTNKKAIQKEPEDGKFKQQKFKRTSHTQQDDLKSQTNHQEDTPNLCRYTSLQQECPNGSNSPLLSQQNQPFSQRELKLSKSQLQICLHIEHQISEYERKKQESERSQRQKYYGKELLDTKHNSSIAMVQSQLFINKQDSIEGSGLGKWLVLLFVAVLVIAAGWKVTHFKQLGGVKPKQFKQNTKHNAKKSDKPKGEVSNKSVPKRRR